MRASGGDSGLNIELVYYSVGRSQAYRRDHLVGRSQAYWRDQSVGWTVGVAAQSLSVRRQVGQSLSVS